MKKPRRVDWEELAKSMIAALLVAIRVGLIVLIVLSLLKYLRR